MTQRIDGHGRRVIERRFERVDHRVQPRHGALVSGAGRDAGRRADRRHDRHLVARAVEHHHDGRADQQRFGHADRVGLGRREALHAPHHVVAEIAEYARRHRRQPGRHLDARFGEQRSQRIERIAGAGDESVRIGERPAVDLGAIAGRAEDQVGIEADHRIAAALRSALDRFEQEHVARAPARKLEIGRDRRLEIGDQRRDRDLGLARDIGAREGFVVGQRCSSACLAALGGLRTSWWTETPSVRRSAATY